MKLKAGEHIIVCGKTQSGKTFFIQNTLAPNLNAYIVFSEEHKDNWDNYTEVKVTSVDDLKKALSEGYTKIWFEPEYDTPEAYIQIWDDVCKFVLENVENIALINDEITDVSTNQSIAPNHFKLIRKGAKRGITVISASQRPQIINKNIWTQSKHKFLFYSDRYDKNWLQDYVVDVEKVMSVKQDYTYYYDDGNTAEIYKSSSERVTIPKKRAVKIEFDTRKGRVDVHENKSVEEKINKDEKTEGEIKDERKQPEPKRKTYIGIDW